MIEQIQSILDSIAPSFETEAPEDFVELPVIIHYESSPRIPLYEADNKASKERRFFLNVEIFDSVDVSEKVINIIEGLETIKGVLKSEQKIDENGIYGIRLSFEFYQF